MDFKVGDHILLHNPASYMYCFQAVDFYPKSIVGKIIHIDENNYGVAFNPEDCPRSEMGLHRLAGKILTETGWWLSLEELELMHAEVANLFYGPLPKYHKISLKVKELQKRFEERQHVTR
jgi:hypothetical protein